MATIKDGKNVFALGKCLEDISALARIVAHSDLSDVLANAPQAPSTRTPN